MKKKSQLMVRTSNQSFFLIPEKLDMSESIAEDIIIEEELSNNQNMLD